MDFPVRVVCYRSGFKSVSPLVAAYRDQRRIPFLKIALVIFKCDDRIVASIGDRDDRSCRTQVNSESHAMTLPRFPARCGPRNLEKWEKQYPSEASGARVKVPHSLRSGTVSPYALGSLIVTICRGRAAM